MHGQQSCLDWQWDEEKACSTIPYTGVSEKCYCQLVHVYQNLHQVMGLYRICSVPILLICLKPWFMNHDSTLYQLVLILVEMLHTGRNTFRTGVYHHQPWKCNRPNMFTCYVAQQEKAGHNRRQIGDLFEPLSCNTGASGTGRGYKCLE